MLVPAVTTAQTSRADHVVLISIDGLRPEFYTDPSAFGAPTIQQMARDGVHALGVRGVFPSVTYPSHTTLLTGATPAQHGIYYNAPFEPAGQTGRWYWEADSIQVPTLFTAVRAAGKTSAAVMWPVTVNAPVDFLVPEVWSLDRGVERILPMRQLATPGLIEELERDATGRLAANGNSDGNYLTRDDKLGAMAAHILETRTPALTALHLIGTDHFQHEQGRTGDKVQRAVSALDRAVGQLRDAAERAGILERTAFIITGDHGFVNTQLRVDPNVRVAQAGLMDTTPSRGNWRATFHVEGGAAFLHLRTPRDTAAVTLVRRALAAAPASERALYRVVERAELDAIGADPRVPLALTATNGVRMGNASTGAPVRGSSGGTHGYFPTDMPEILTGFVGWGAGFRQGMVLPVMNLTDVAGIAAALLGVPFTAPAGVLQSGALTPAR
jgi:predicted AlkP superfamily pyrophosphatase or phosphodiesterase